MPISGNGSVSSCVVNNGVASKLFYLERGVHQGCPLSGILFVIAMELLAQSIRRSNNIKGIYIQGNEEVKLTQYADDTTAILSNVKSVSNLFSDDPVYALGVHFTYNTELSYKKHFFDKLGSLKKTLSVWSRRDLSIYGRINIVNT